jgi:hypothetical protein
VETLAPEQRQPSGMIDVSVRLEHGGDGLGVELELAIAQPRAFTPALEQAAVQEDADPVGADLMATACSLACCPKELQFHILPFLDAPDAPRIFALERPS